MKSKGLLISMLVLLVFSIFIGTLGCGGGEAGPTPTAGAKELRIGIITALTGPASSLFYGFKQCWDLHAEQQNAAGGLTIDGEQYLVRLEYYDDGFTVEGTVAAFQLMRSNGIKIFQEDAIGPEAINRAASAAGMFTIAWSGLYLPCEPYGENRWQLHVGGLQNNLAAVVYGAQNYPEAKKFGMLGRNDEIAHFSADGIQQLCETELAGRFELIPPIYYEPGTTDYKPLLVKLLQDDPDIINNLQAPPDEALLMIKQARELGYTGIIQSIYAFTLEEIRAVMSDQYIYGITVAGAAYWEKPPAQLQPFLEQFEARYGELPQPNVAYSLATLPTLFKAIQEANSIEPSEITKVLESWTNYETPFGTYSFGGEETIGCNRIAQGGQCMTVIHSVDNWETVLTPAAVVP